LFNQSLTYTQFFASDIWGLRIKGVSGQPEFPSGAIDNIRIYGVPEAGPALLLLLVFPSLGWWRTRTT
jgi:hypothetical protein